MKSTTKYKFKYCFNKIKIVLLCILIVLAIISINILISIFVILPAFEIDEIVLSYLYIFVPLLLLIFEWLIVFTGIYTKKYWDNIPLPKEKKND